MIYPEITPVELRGGRWYKRDDEYRHPSGVNGGKWRQCRWLMGRAVDAGYRRVVSGASILSPQLPMAAVAAHELGMPIRLVIGGTTLELAARQAGIRIAQAAGADFDTIAVGYNPAIQSHVRKLAAAQRAYLLPYGIGPDPESELRVFLDFHMLGAHEVANLAEAKPHTVIMPLGTGNSAASVLLGLARMRFPWLRRVLLVGIGPTRFEWLRARLGALEGIVGVGRVLGAWGRDFAVDHVDLHAAGLVNYHQRVRFDADGLILHPTYEAKIAAWLENNPDYAPGWTARDGTALFWVVGGPLKVGRTSAALRN